MLIKVTCDSEVVKSRVMHLLNGEVSKIYSLVPVEVYDNYETVDSILKYHALSLRIKKRIDLNTWQTFLFDVGDFLTFGWLSKPNKEEMQSMRWSLVKSRGEDLSELLQNDKVISIYWEPSEFREYLPHEAVRVGVSIISREPDMMSEFKYEVVVGLNRVDSVKKIREITKHITDNMPRNLFNVDK